MNTRMIMILKYDRAGGGRGNGEGGGGKAEGACERRWRRKRSGIYLCLGVCIRSACAFVCTLSCVACSLRAHVFTRKSLVLSMNAPVRGLRCRLVPRFENALAPAHSMRQSVVRSEHQALCDLTRTHVRACVRAYMQAGACHGMHVAACSCAFHLNKRKCLGFRSCASTR